ARFPHHAEIRGALLRRQGHDRPRLLGSVRTGFALHIRQHVSLLGAESGMTMLNKSDIETLGAAAAKSSAALFAAIAEVARRRVDAGLVTAMRHDEAESTVERIYSSNEAAYPSGGRKPKRENGWGRKVLVEHRVLVSGGDDGIRETFPDHAIIFGLGLHSC